MKDGRKLFIADNCDCQVVHCSAKTNHTYRNGLAIQLLQTLYPIDDHKVKVVHRRHGVVAKCQHPQLLAPTHTLDVIKAATGETARKKF